MSAPADPAAARPAGPTLAEALHDARHAGLDRVDAHALLGALLGRDRAWLIAHDDQRLDAVQTGRWADWLRRRADGVPVAYLTGTREFHGLRLQVGPAVLDPRPDTEVLVDWALERLDALAAAGQPQARVLDLGTGSGAIALSVAHARPAATVSASDLSPDALAQAQANAQALGLRLQAWYQGPWWDPLPQGERWHLLLSNPPYIAGDDPHLPALRHEPRLALTPEGDGLDALRVLAAGARARLEPDGWLLLEHGWDQGPAVRALLQAAGFTDVATREDLGGQPRCTGGRSPAGTTGAS
ncbi:peptide chain release factor N(5)-glutamine methyltransferase [Pseudaquabacterium rugosum]|uniref:Release factor glutamine methyltransferase n=1 Tax=Pseudaquabacterium rugosum TaxID=2984194 RepID=A0ABU9B4I6_9BURK